jgi:superfamily II DNA or RNA helicase
MGFATPLKINMLYLDYLDNDTKRSFYELHGVVESSKLFQEEKKIINSNEKRLDYVVNLINKTTKNTLVLFHIIEYGEKLYNKLLKIRGKNVYLVHGKTKKETREIYKQYMETKNKKGENKIMVASYGTYAVGISIKNIHNIFFAESFKSHIIVFQSLGRLMRQLEGKLEAVIYDLIDDFTWENEYGLKRENYVIKHSKERKKMYDSQKFPCKKITCKF